MATADGSGTTHMQECTLQDAKGARTLPKSGLEQNPSAKLTQYLSTPRWTQYWNLRRRDRTSSCARMLLASMQKTFTFRLLSLATPFFGLFWNLDWVVVRVRLASVWTFLLAGFFAGLCIGIAFCLEFWPIEGKERLWYVMIWYDVIR